MEFLAFSDFARAQKNAVSPGSSVQCERCRLGVRAVLACSAHGSGVQCSAPRTPRARFEVAVHPDGQSLCVLILMAGWHSHITLVQMQFLDMASRDPKASACSAAHIVLSPKRKLQKLVVSLLFVTRIWWFTYVNKNHERHSFFLDAVHWYYMLVHFCI